MKKMSYFYDHRPSLVMVKKLHILILQDIATDAELIECELQEAKISYVAKRVATEREYIRELKYFHPDLIISDYDLPQYNGALALAAAKMNCPFVPFIIVTGAIDENLIRVLLINGATYYVVKSHLKMLVPVIKKAIEGIKIVNDDNRNSSHKHWVLKGET